MLPTLTVFFKYPIVLPACMKITLLCIKCLIKTSQRIIDMPISESKIAGKINLFTFISLFDLISFASWYFVACSMVGYCSMQELVPADIILCLR